MIKKQIALLVLLTAALVLLLSSCAGQNKPADDNKPGDATQAPAATEATVDDATEKPVATEAPVVTDAPTEEPATEVPATDAPTDVPEPTEAVDPTEGPELVPIESGTNVALDAEVDVSSTTGESHASIGFGPEHINDGYYYEPSVPSVGWTTNVSENFDDPEQEEWAELKLAQDTAINKIIVYPVVNGGRFPVAFQLQVSMDGKNYTTVAEVKDNSRFDDKDDSPFEFEFETVICRYVKFLATELCEASPRDGYLCQVAEIEIYAA
jgi:hypothetical protein